MKNHGTLDDTLLAIESGLLAPEARKTVWTFIADILGEAAAHVRLAADRRALRALAYDADCMSAAFSERASGAGGFEAPSFDNELQLTEQIVDIDPRLLAMTLADFETIKRVLH